MKTFSTKTVTERALVARINRKLHHEEAILHKSRGARALLDLGEFYIRSWRLNTIDDSFVDPEALGRELGVLAENEVVS